MKGQINKFDIFDKNQIKILEMKSSMSQIKIDSLLSWLVQMKDQISGPEDKLNMIEKLYDNEGKK
jgi:hypothetical protein